MGTRSRIGIRNADDSVDSIYCHWDGYPDHNGRLLVTDIEMPGITGLELAQRVQRHELPARAACDALRRACAYC